MKTHLIVKSPELYEKAEEIFGRDGIKVTTDGARHIGAVIGSKEYKEQYVHNKVKKWMADVAQLSLIAQEEPQIALKAFNTGLNQRWKFVQRTVPDTKNLFDPLEIKI